MSHHPDQDSQVIDRTLKEIGLAESTGMDAVWLTEHHFNGECAYADPIVFGAAIASRTSRIKIGFAVIQMSLHDPVRLATQTALLDNLSHGRLIVGTGRGSAFNHFEYAGFGTDMDEGAEKMAEAEELLVKAWTVEGLEFHGRYWNVSLPMLRPQPFQKPHPPLVRACLGEKSISEMAKIGRPILVGGVGNKVIGERLQTYREMMVQYGFGQRAIDEACNMSWVSKNLCVADSYEEAKEIVQAGYCQDMEHIRNARRKYNPPTETLAEGGNDKDMFDDQFILGSPSQVADQVAELRDIGVCNLMLENSFGEMSLDQVSRTLNLFAEEVAPLFVR